MSAIDHDLQQMKHHQLLLLERIEKLEQRLDTCGGIHKPFEDIVWPPHCHTRRCPRCGRDYPL